MIEWTRMSSNSQKAQATKKPGAPDPKESIIYRLDPVREAGRLIFQVGTSDPERAVAAARVVAGDVAGIDVNAGCPKPFSTSGGMGAALLRKPDLLCSILRSLVDAIVPEFNIGVSVKIRLLETPTETEALVRALVATGIVGLTVHCRTTPMRPRERAIRGQLRMVADVCREAGVACLMNGDVTGRDEALLLAQEYGADGAMIATAAESNSSCFRTEAEGGLAGWQEVAEKYVDFAIQVGNRWGNTKYTLNQLVPGKLPLYRDLGRAKCYTEACEALEFTRLLEKAREVDSRLELLSSAELAASRKGGGKANGNSVALAAGGDMAKARRSSASQPRKSISERGVAAQPAVAQPAAATVALPT